MPGVWEEMERKRAKVKVRLVADENPICNVCGSSEIVKAGISMVNFSSATVATFIQRYKCKRCGSNQRAGANSKAGPRYRFDRVVVNHAMSLIGSGESTRDVSDAIKKKFRLRVSAGTISKWAKTFLKKDWKRDRTARAKVLKVLESNASKDLPIKTVSKLSGVNYNPGKTVLRRLKKPTDSKPQKKAVILLQKRKTYLERRISDMRDELERLRRA